MSANLHFNSSARPRRCRAVRRRSSPRRLCGDPARRVKVIRGTLKRRQSAEGGDRARWNEEGRGGTFDYGAIIHDIDGVPFASFPFYLRFLHLFPTVPFSAPPTVPSLPPLLPPSSFLFPLPSTSVATSGAVRKHRLTISPGGLFATAVLARYVPL